VRLLKRGNVKSESGFSLIELMIVVVVVAILAGVAYPLYTNQVMKGNRAQAKTRMVQAAQLLERFYSDNNTYYVDVASGKAVSSTTGSTAGGFAALMNVPSGTVVYSGANNESSSPYIVTLATASPNAFTLTATPQPPLQNKDSKCMNLTLTNTGVKGFSGSGSMQDCW
jgi:type IV pilus assembly protein PilE